MIHALHGNVGLPDDLFPLLHATGRGFKAWHLWRWLEENRAGASFAAFAGALLEAAMNDTGPRILLGYSLGARLALHTLMEQPGLWDAAVLISAHPGLISEEERAARLVADQAWAARFVRDPWPDVIASWNAQPVLAGEGVSLTNQLLVQTWRREVATGFDVWSLGRQSDFRPLMPSVSCPVLWITGGEDAKFTALGTECCALLPQSQHRIIPGAGHRAHQSEPAREAVCGFLERVSGR